MFAVDDRLIDARQDRAPMLHPAAGVIETRIAPNLIRPQRVEVAPIDGLGNILIFAANDVPLPDYIRQWWLCGRIDAGRERRISVPASPGITIEIGGDGEARKAPSLLAAASRFG